MRQEECALCAIVRLVDDDDDDDDDVVVVVSVRSPLFPFVYIIYFHFIWAHNARTHRLTATAHGTYEQNEERGRPPVLSAAIWAATS